VPDAELKSADDAPSMQASVVPSPELPMILLLLSEVSIREKPAREIVVALQGLNVATHMLLGV